VLRNILELPIDAIDALAVVARKDIYVLNLPLDFLGDKKVLGLDSRRATVKCYRIDYS